MSKKKKKRYIIHVRTYLTIPNNNNNSKRTMIPRLIRNVPFRSTMNRYIIQCMEKKINLINNVNNNNYNNIRRTTINNMYHYQQPAILLSSSASSFSTKKRSPPDINFLLNQVEMKGIRKKVKKKNNNNNTPMNTDHLKLKQRYGKRNKNISEEGEIIKSRRQLRNNRVIHEIIMEMFAFGTVRFGNRKLDSRIVEITGVNVSRDNKTATVSWAFDEMFLQSNNFKQMKRGKANKGRITSSTPTKKEIDMISDELKKAMPQIRWHITKVMKGRRAPSLWFVYDASLDIDIENLDTFNLIKELEEKRMKLRGGEFDDD